MNLKPFIKKHFPKTYRSIREDAVDQSDFETTISIWLNGVVSFRYSVAELRAIQKSWNGAPNNCQIHFRADGNFQEADRGDFVSTLEQLTTQAAEWPGQAEHDLYMEQLKQEKFGAEGAKDFHHFIKDTIGTEPTSNNFTD